MSRRGEDPPTEELSWNAWAGSRPGESGPAGYPITTETAEPRLRPGGPGQTPEQPGGRRNPVSALRARFLRGR